MAIASNPQSSRYPGCRTNEICAVNEISGQGNSTKKDRERPRENFERVEKQPMAITFLCDNIT